MDQRPKLTKKGYFHTKTKKVNITNEFCIFKLVWVLNFYFKQFWILRPNFSKKSISGPNRKSSHHHWILHIRLRLGFKFQLKLTILIFWTNFFPTLVFQKIALLQVPVVITYYGKLIRKMANRHNHISVSLLLLVAETIRNTVNIYFANNLPLT